MDIIFNWNLNQFTKALKANDVAMARRLKQSRCFNVQTQSYEEYSYDQIYEGVPLLAWAARDSEEAIVKLLLSEKANVNTVSTSGCSALLFAVGWHRLTIVQLLIDANADVNLADQTKKTPLHNAASVGADGPIKKLLAAKASLNIRNENEETPLMLAAEKGYAVAGRH